MSGSGSASPLGPPLVPLGRRRRRPTNAQLHSRNNSNSRQNMADTSASAAPAAPGQPAPTAADTVQGNDLLLYYHAYSFYSQKVTNPSPAPQYYHLTSSIETNLHFINLFLFSLFEYFQYIPIIFQMLILIFIPR